MDRLPVLFPIPPSYIAGHFVTVSDQDAKRRREIQQCEVDRGFRLPEKPDVDEGLGQSLTGQLIKLDLVNDEQEAFRAIAEGDSRTWHAALCRSQLTKAMIKSVRYETATAEWGFDGGAAQLQKQMDRQKKLDEEASKNKQKSKQQGTSARSRAATRGRAGSAGGGNGSRTGHINSSECDGEESISCEESSEDSCNSEESAGSDD